MNPFLPWAALLLVFLTVIEKQIRTVVSSKHASSTEIRRDSAVMFMACLSHLCFAALLSLEGT